MLSEKVIVVTGGTGLLGCTFVESIIKNNGVAVIADILEENGKRIEIELNEKYGDSKALFCLLDITNKDSILNFIYKVNEKYNKIDGIVNSAYPRNKNYGRQFFDIEYQDFCDNVSLHLGGYFLINQLFAKYFLKQGYGNIINISSIYGVISPRFEVYEGTDMTMPVEYAAIKSAIIHLTKYMAKYLKGVSVRVNCISPGGIYNNQPEPFLKKYAEYCSTKGMLDKEDLCGAVLFLLSENSKYINGQNLIIDDGFSL